MRKNQSVPQADKYLVSICPDSHIRKEGINTAPDYTLLRKIVGGPIELIPYFNKYGESSCIAFRNEEGKLPHFNLPPNLRAQELWQQAVGRIITEDYLVGTIAIIVGPEKFLKTL